MTCGAPTAARVSKLVRSSEQHEIYGGGGRGKPGAVRAM